MTSCRQTLALALAVLLFPWPNELGAFQTPPPAPPPAASGPEAPKQTPEQLQQLAAPIALYPDALIAQVLAASTYPAQVVEADRWLQAHPDWKEEKLAKETNKQPWDPSVKAMIQFPSVLGNMDKNLAWTSSLGDAYINQQEDLFAAIQTMRRQAQSAGNLASNNRQTVTTEGQTIQIAPADPEVVYVPVFDPWLVYGYPIAIWPEWYWYPGLFIEGPGIGWGFGFGIGFFAGFGWGWHSWGFDWHGRGGVYYNHQTYVSHSATFAERNRFESGRGTYRSSGDYGRGGGYSRGVESRGGGAMRGGAFSGSEHGSSARSEGFRGAESFGGGFHGGGFHGGGGRR